MQVLTAGADRRLKDSMKQARFAGALMLTALAKDGQAAAAARIDEAFDRPTRFTQRGPAITPANKQTLASAIFVKDVQAEYLDIQEKGGRLTPKPGSPVIFPVNLGLNALGNIPRGKIKRALKRGDTFVSNQDEPRTKHLPPGIYQRGKRGKRRDGGKGAKGPLHDQTGRRTGGRKGLSSVKLLVALHKVAVYKPRFDFKPTVVEAVKAHIGQRWREAQRRAFDSARK